MIVKSFSNNSLECIQKKILKEFKSIEFNSFGLGISCDEKIKNDLKKNFQPLLIKKLIKESKKIFSPLSPDVFVLIDFFNKKIFFQIKPLFFTGYYNKFDRNLAQTIHYCFHCKGKGCSKCNFSGRTGILSIQEIIAKTVLKFFKAKNHKFHGQGREDIDVLMLGKGRKFVFEVIEPRKRFIDLNLIEKKVNKDKRIKISNLSFCEKEEIIKVKQKKCAKLYEALIECLQPISFNDLNKLKKLKGKVLKVIQQTPLRVLKRRKNVKRLKKIKILQIKEPNSNFFWLKLKCSHGFYVKEFISSDNNRTNPSISSILKKPCLCHQLNVLKIFNSNKV